MSKRRSSKAAATPGLPPPLPQQGNPGQPWLRRVFHNTYTRRGQRIALRGWSVKIQYGGQRRTFSLAARTRLGAAAEARAIQEEISVEGWEAVVRHYGGRRGRALSKADSRWWQERLLLRNYPAPGGGGRQQEFSTHIEHTGTACFLPLGTGDPEAAALRALEIYRQVIEAGWRTAWKSYPREVTVAFHWGCDPLLWTYTTVHTVVGGSLQRPSARPRRTGAEPPSYWSKLILAFGAPCLSASTDMKVIAASLAQPQASPGVRARSEKQPCAWLIGI